MSNPESNPSETLCRPAGSGACFEVLEPRDVPLGGVRAMTVRRTLPQRSRSLIGAWCFLDHYGPDDVSVTGGMNVPAHPHIGLQTVSWLFSGEIEHRDSAGHHACVRPGELNLMTAGDGISHSERSTPDTAILHGAQLWVVLPEETRHGERRFEHYAPPVVTGEGWRAQVFLGSVFGSTSPVATDTPLLGAELRLDAGATVSLDVDPAFEHGVLSDAGPLEVRVEPSDDRCSLAEDHLAYLPPGADRVTLAAGDEGARLLLIGGTPFPEEIIMWWNFIGRDHDEIVAARNDWQAQIAAVGVGDVANGELVVPPVPSLLASGRYGLPEGEPEPPLPAPPTPAARLRPRTRGR